ncbi:MAG: M36 family metallopeptidase [Acidobacteriota bacterium]
MRNATHRLLIGAAAALLLASAGWSAEVHLNGAADGRMLTGPQVGDAADIALTYVNANLAALQLTPADVSDLELRDRYTSPNGITHLYWLQRHDGIGVHNGILGVNIAADGSIINVHHRMIPDLATRAPAGGPALQPSTAVQRAAEHLGIESRLSSIDPLEIAGGPTARVTFSDAGISRDPIPAELRYQRRADGTVALAWNVVINRVDSQDWMEVRIDALSGELVDENNWTAHGTNEYRVYPLPLESPNDGPQVLIPEESDATASPFGWHDDDGAAGAEYTDTRGNNVWAQDDLDGNNTGGTRPDGGAGLSFDFAHDDVNDGPTDGTNLQASIVNLFYYNNIMHDISYHYGFDEPAGNFQTNNYGNGGVGNDPVNADALDGSGTDNATFSTPPDGTRPRMSMFLWTAPPSLEVNSPGSIAGTYTVGGASFGALLDATGVTGDLRLTDDGSMGDGTGTTTDACEALPANSMDGLIAVIDRGSCEFGLKVLNAENAGAIAAIVVNNQGDGTLTMGPGVNGGAVTIPSVFLGQSDGDAIKAELPGTVNVTMSKVGVDRDSDFDNGVIAHEYGHGISNRLTGGPSAVGCLPTTIPGGTSEQAGEGWSDFWALVLAAVPSDTATTGRGIGTYLTFEAADGFGIRNARYSTDESTNAIHDYANVGTINAPHGVGEIWMAAVWEMYWELVARYGFDTDFYNGTGGNNLTIQLVIDGMKLQPCQPTFSDARDAILMADMVNNGGDNQCAIWRSFAKRGIGVNADSGDFIRGDETPDYTTPLGCEAGIFTDGFESGNTTAWSNSVP